MTCDGNRLKCVIVRKKAVTHRGDAEAIYELLSKDYAARKRRLAREWEHKRKKKLQKAKNSC